MKSAKERIKDFVAFKGITVDNFSIENSISKGYFNKIGAIGSDMLMNIFIHFPELNFDWVITGRGDMLLENSRKCTECEALEKELNKEIREHSKTKTELIELQKNLQPVKLQKLK